MKKNKALVLLSCLVFVLVLIVGISTSNSVKVDEGETQKKVGPKEDERFSVQLKELSTGQAVEGAEIISDITNDGLELSGGSIMVHNPGDYVAYTFDIVNDGNVNSELSLLEIPSLTCTSTDGNVEIAQKVCEQMGIDISYNYEPNKSVEIGDSLAKGTTTSFTMSIIYNNGPEVIENVNVQVDGIKVVFGYQKNNTAKITVGQKN